MTLFLNEILNRKVGTVTLNIPDSSGDGTTNTLQGFLTESPAFSLQNTWGSIFPDFNALGEMSQLMGNADIFSWLGATQAGWKGTEPLTISIEFYMISFNSTSNIKSEVAKLIKMATLHTSNGTTFTDATTVQVHGGYSSNYWNGNSSSITNAEQAKTGVLDSSKAKGLITMTVGDGQFRLNNLLLSDVQVAPSVVQVAEGTPLFIKVNASFRTYRAALDTDIDSMYGIASKTAPTPNTTIGTVKAATPTPTPRDKVINPATPARANDPALMGSGF